MHYLNKILLYIWAAFMWLVFPPAFVYLVKDSKTLKKPYKTAAYVSLIISPGTIVILGFIIGLIESIIPDNYPIKDLEKNLNIQLTEDYDVITNDIKHQGQDYTATVEIKLSDESFKNMVHLIIKSEYYNVKDPFIDEAEQINTDTVFSNKMVQYLQKKHLVGYWIKKNDSLYEFYRPKISDVPNSAVLFHEGYDIDANLNVKNKVLEYRYFKY